jgi:hypothetical protein
LFDGLVYIHIGNLRRQQRTGRVARLLVGLPVKATAAILGLKVKSVGTAYE